MRSPVVETDSIFFRIFQTYPKQNRVYRDAMDEGRVEDRTEGRRCPPWNSDVIAAFVASDWSCFFGIGNKFIETQDMPPISLPRKDNSQMP
jgi:hypothetical protein